MPFPCPEISVFPLPEALWWDRDSERQKEGGEGLERQARVWWGRNGPGEGITPAGVSGFEFNPGSALGKLVHLFRPHFHSIWSGALGRDGTRLAELLCGFHEFIHTEYLEPCLVQSKCFLTISFYHHYSYWYNILLFLSLQLMAVMSVRTLLRTGSLRLRLGVWHRCP